MRGRLGRRRKVNWTIDGRRLDRRRRSSPALDPASKRVNHSICQQQYTQNHTGNDSDCGDVNSRVHLIRNCGRRGRQSCRREQLRNTTVSLPISTLVCQETVGVRGLV